MDPMSLITGAISAASAGLSALTSIFGAADSIAQLVTKFVDAVKGMIKEPQSDQVNKSVKDNTSELPQREQNYALTTAQSIFSPNSVPASSQQPLAA